MDAQSEELPGQEGAKEQRNPRVRLSRRALKVLEKYRGLGLNPNQIVENALVIADNTLSLSSVTLSDLVGVMTTHRAAVKDLNLCLLETFELLTDVELLLEHQMLLSPLKTDLEKFKERSRRQS